MATPLDVIRLDQPCQMPWDDMHGDGRVRYCTQCDLHVHNLSAMTAGEAAAFVAMRRGRVCVAYERRADGTAAFADAGAATGAAAVSATPAGDAGALPVVPYATPPVPRRRWLVPAAVAGAMATAGAMAALKPAGPSPGTTMVAGGMPVMVPGGITPPPLVQFDPRNAAETTLCHGGESARLRSQLQFDPLGKALLDALPEGLDVTHVRYSVYPAGTPAVYGQVYVVASPGGGTRAIVWALPRGTTVATIGHDGTAVRPLIHATTTADHELFLDADDPTIRNALRGAFAGDDALEGQTESKTAASS